MCYILIYAYRRRHERMPEAHAYHGYICSAAAAAEPPAPAASEPEATKANPFDRAAVDLRGVGVSIIY